MASSSPKPKKTSWLNNLLKIPEGQDLIYWMLEKQNNLPAQLIGLIGFTFLFRLSTGSYWGSLAVLLAMFLHEIGHHFVFRANRIKSIVRILFPLGAVAAPINKNENAKSDQLPWWNVGWLLLAGLTMNVIQMAIGLYLIFTNTLPELGHQMVQINGLLAVMNLLPLWKMDGAQFFHVIFSSLKEKYDLITSGITNLIAVVIIGFLFLVPANDGYISIIRSLFQHLGLIIFLIVMAAGVWQRQRSDKPAHSESIQAMKPIQAVILISFYGLLVASTFFLFSL